MQGSFRSLSGLPHRRISGRERTRVPVLSGLWKLTRLRDAFGNWLDISYDGDDWNLTDIHGRSHTVSFDTETDPDHPGQPRSRLSKVELSGPAGTTAIFYAGLHPDHNRPAELHKTDLCPLWAWQYPFRVDVDRFRAAGQLLLVDGIFHIFAFVALSGGISHLRVPTGGKIEWTYRSYRFPSQSPINFQQAWMNNAQGVETRTLYWDPDDVTKKGTWIYDYTTDGPGMPPDPGFPAISCFHRQRIIDPAGDTTEYFFSTLRSAHFWTYGLPYTYCDPTTGAMATSGPFLSERRYQGSATGGTLKREIWVEFTADGISVGSGFSDQESNARMVYRKEVFHDDGGKIRETLHSDFDGLGHFRTTLERGDFGPEKVSQVDYVPAGTLLIDPENSTPQSGNSFALPTNQIWLFGLSTGQGTTQRLNSGDPGTTSKSQTCYTSQGFLSFARTLSGSRPAGNDLVLEQVPEIAPDDRHTGFVAEQKLYSGDGAAEPLDTGSLCSIEVPDAPGAGSRTISRVAWSRVP